MPLYVAPAFAPTDPALALRVIDEHPFAILVTPLAGEPQITHLPLLRDGDDALVGHVARGNPHWRALGSADSVAVFAGPHAYVSPTWYEAPEAAVPTWNYVTVHVAGRARLVADRDVVERLMAHMVERFEGTADAAWRFALDGPRRAAMLGGIVAFRLPMTRVTAKLKLSQNRTPSDAGRVADALAASPDADARRTAAWMRLVRTSR